MVPRLRFLVPLIGLVLVMGGASAEVGDLGPSYADTGSDPTPQARTGGTRRVNAPHFDGEVLFSETAISWFGRITHTENSVDVRVGYNDDHLWVRLGVIDRHLWYDDTSPSPGDLTAWDGASLYLDLDGNLGDVPYGNAYRFDAQLVWWEPRAEYQAAYAGDGSEWVMTTLPFTTTSLWRSSASAPNDDVYDLAWALTYTIPFDSLDLSGPPARNTVWGMGVVVHDRDDAAGALFDDQTWPETMETERPATWGQLAFGMPIYTPQSAIPEGSLTVRQGLNGASVVDADVGGARNCGQPAWADIFSLWGELNYAGEEVVNIQNLADIGDWTCFSRYYVTFPLDNLPSEKVIISATLTLFQWGNAGEGWDPGPQPSLLQVHSVDQAWDEGTLTWNNAPLASENVAAAWADVFPEWPGEAREWDVSRAVAEAYAAGTPLRLALYESDWAYHSGKYFWSSDVEDWYQERRPTLTITWGRALADIDKKVTPSAGDQGSTITYTLSFLGTGNTLFLTDTLPVGVDYLGGFQPEGTGVEPTYDSNQHRITWTDAPALGQEVIIRYPAGIATGESEALVNSAELAEVDGSISTATAVVITNPRRTFLPVILRA